MQTKLMLVSEYRETFFTTNSRPAINTLKKWIREGDLQGIRIGCLYYVEVPVDNHLTKCGLERATLQHRAGF